MTKRRRNLHLWPALALGLTAAWFTKTRCLLLDSGWENGEEYTSYCYSDIFPLWWVERLNVGAVPYLDHPVEYPVLTGAWMYVANALAMRFPAGLQSRAFLHITILIGAACFAGTFVLLRRMGVPPARLLWFALAPTLIVYGFMNWDALPVLLATLAIAMHRQRRDVAAGVAAGLGAAAKLYPAFFLPVFALARLRQRDLRGALLTVGAGAAAWLATNVPVFVVAPDGWGRFLELSRTRLADHDSLYRILEVGLRADVRFDVPTLNIVTGVLFLIGAAIVLWFGTRRRDAADWWQLVLPVLITFLLTSKVYSPQFSVWLLPLLVLVLRRPAPFLAFAAVDLAVFLTRFAWLGGRQGYQPAPGYGVFATAVVLRALVLLWIVWLTVRQRDAAPDEPQPDEPAGYPAAVAAS